MLHCIFVFLIYRFADELNLLSRWLGSGTIRIPRAERCGPLGGANIGLAVTIANEEVRRPGQV